MEVSFTAPADLSFYNTFRLLLSQGIQSSGHLALFGRTNFFNGAGNPLSFNTIKNCTRSITAIKTHKNSAKRTEKRITSQIEQESKRVLCSTELEVKKKTIDFLNVGVL